MLLDDSHFPIVHLRPHEDDRSSLDEVVDRNRQFERLLDRQAPFVLIADHPPHDHADETAEERKEKALFFKRIKDRMRRYCLGLVVIEGDSSANAAARIAAVAAGKALGFAIQFAPDAEDATAKGRALLAREAGAGSSNPEIQSRG